MQGFHPQHTPSLSKTSVQWHYVADALQKWQNWPKLEGLVLILEAGPTLFNRIQTCSQFCLNKDLEPQLINEVGRFFWQTGWVDQNYPERLNIYCEPPGQVLFAQRMMTLIPEPLVLPTVAGAAEPGPWRTRLQPSRRSKRCSRCGRFEVVVLEVVMSDRLLGIHALFGGDFPPSDKIAEMLIFRSCAGCSRFSLKLSNMKALGAAINANVPAKTLPKPCQKKIKACNQKPAIT